MLRAIVELTNRCNLACSHCPAERHRGTADMGLDILERLLAEGKECGLEFLSFTGGEPTVHRAFAHIVREVADAGYRFSLVSNGVNFPKVYSHLLRHRAHLSGLTFSLDGACEQTHDRLRGEGSYRRVMKAASICVARDLPFQFNMVLTRDNQSEIEEMIDIATRLGSGGVQFGQLMFNDEVGAAGLDLDVEQRRALEARIWRLREQAAIAVGIAPGYYSESPFFPCGPLELEEFNVDCQGNVTLCCHLSRHFGPSETEHVLGNLREVSLAQALRSQRDRVARYLADKRERIRRGDFGELDHYPCWYCVNYLRRGDAPESIPIQVMRQAS